MNYFDFFTQSIVSLKNEGRYRTFVPLERIVGRAPYATWHKDDKTHHEVIVWCSNDYLGMSHHPEVVAALKEGAKLYGAGSGGTRNISGTAQCHRDLEKTVANLHEKEAALTFTSGYTANEATIATLAENLPGCIVLSDAKNHASIIQGIRHSGAEKYVFPHNDMVALEEKLKTLPLSQPKLIVVVSVYSMDGDIAPLEKLCELKEKYNALLFVDEVHAVGIYGPRGAGIVSLLGLQNRVDIIQANFAKAYGVIGGYIAGSSSLVDFVRSHASGFIFTTSLPPATAMAAQKSVEVLMKDEDIRRDLQEKAQYLKNELSKTDVIFGKNKTHITPVWIGHAQKCKEMCDYLINDRGIYLQPINYPTVPRGQERLRVTVTPFHTYAMIDDLVDALQKAWSILKLRDVA